MLAGATGRLLGERHIAAPAERYSAKAILGAARGTLAAPAKSSLTRRRGWMFPLSRPISARLLVLVPVALLPRLLLAHGGVARDLLASGGVALDLLVPGGDGLAGLLPEGVPVTRVTVGPLGAVGGLIAIGLARRRLVSLRAW